MWDCPSCRNTNDIATHQSETFVLTKQENMESIHQHNAFAERSGTLGELRQEVIEGEPVLQHTTLEEWLKG